MKQQLNNSSKSTRDTLISGQSIVAKLNDTANEVDGENNNVHTIMMELKEDSNNIEQITGAMTDIAEQTMANTEEISAMTQEYMGQAENAKALVLELIETSKEMKKYF